MDGADLPEPSGPPASHDAVGYIIDTCRAQEGVWLVPTGPLTNIALALRAAPDIAGRIAGISLMGGGTFGNTHRRGRVQHGVRPRGRRHRVRLRWAADHGRPRSHPPVPGSTAAHRDGALPARAAGRGARRTCSTSSAAPTGRATTTSAALPCTIRARCWHSPTPTCSPAAWPTWRSRPQGVRTAGMTVIDQRDLKEVPAPNCDMQIGLDADEAWQVIVECRRPLLALTGAPDDQAQPRADRRATPSPGSTRAPSGSPSANRATSTWFRATGRGWCSPAAAPATTR